MEAGGGGGWWLIPCRFLWKVDKIVSWLHSKGWHLLGWILDPPLQTDRHTNLPERGSWFLRVHLLFIARHHVLHRLWFCLLFRREYFLVLAVLCSAALHESPGPVNERAHHEDEARAPERDSYDLTWNTRKKEILKKYSRWRIQWPQGRRPSPLGQIFLIFMQLWIKVEQFLFWPPADWLLSSRLCIRMQGFLFLKRKDWYNSSKFWIQNRKN